MSSLDERPAYIIDTDPGVDDCVALILALRHLNVIGLTIVAGNTSVENGTRNALEILRVCGRTDIPVYKGREGALVRDATMNGENYHGKYGFLGYWDTHTLDPTLTADDKPAALALLDASRTYSQLHVIALGPLTNIALAL
jgi:purine nucleosidase